MVGIITLDDGRLFGWSSFGVQGMLILVSEQLDPSLDRFRHWLIDKAYRCAPFQDFDTRGFVEDDRQAFWIAAADALDALAKRLGPDFLKREDAYSANCLHALLLMRRSMLAGEPPGPRDINPNPNFIDPVDFDDLWYGEAGPETAT